MAAWLGWQAMLALVRTTFPETQHVSTDELASAVAAQDVAVLLLDVRRREEYEVSHLEGAVWVGEAPTRMEKYRFAYTKHYFFPRPII